MSVSDLSNKRKLIDIVEKNPDLWRLTKKAPNLKQKLWNIVGEELGTSGFDARRQWEILRDQFRREYKRFTFDSNYKSKWMLYNRMLFVRHALRPREGHNPHQFHWDTEEHGFEEQKVEVDIGQMVEQNWSTQSDIDSNMPKIQVRQDLQGSSDSAQSQVTNLEIDGEPSTSAGVSSSSRRPHSYDEIDFSSTRRKRRWHPEGDEDEDYHFVMSILPSLRSIQHTKKLRVRSKIMELIATELDADFGVDHKLQLPLLQELRTDSESEDKFLTEARLKDVQ